MSDEEIRGADENGEGSTAELDARDHAGLAPPEPLAGVREIEQARALQRGEEWVEEHDALGCHLCPGCATRIAITEAAIVGLVRRVAERDEMIAELAGALAAAKPLFESLIPAEGEDPPSLLKVLAKLSRGGR